MVILWLYACLLKGYVMSSTGAGAESGVRTLEVMVFLQSTCAYARAKSAEEVAVTVESG